MFQRKRDNKKIYYVDSKNKVVTNPKHLKYIQSLVIPPAWDNVVINKKKSKVLATGIDQKNRKQYIYSQIFKDLQKNKKFNRIYLFAKKINKIMNKIKQNLLLNSKKFNKIACINLILYIVFITSLRIGNKENVRKYNSYGVSTLQGRHIKIKNDTVYIKFIGKKGVENKAIIREPMVVHCLKSWKRKFRIKSNDPFFQYIYNNNVYTIHSVDVNNCLKIYGPFSVKDFRTLNANIMLIKEFVNMNYDEQKNITRQINNCYRNVAEKLNNTMNVCKKEYCDSTILDRFLENPEIFQKHKKIRRHLFVEPAYIKLFIS